MCWHKKTYIYKIVDDAGMEVAKKGQISLSHPIFEMKGSEGEIINFAKRIYDRYCKNNKGLSIKPSNTDLDEIKAWISVYKKTFGPGFEDHDIVSESMILFCGIVQGFCGYFTKTNLFNKRKLKSFLNKNEGHLSRKIGVVRLDTSVFNHKHWRTDDLHKPFTEFFGDEDDIHDYNGFAHLIDISYTSNFNDYTTLLSKYNGDELRDASNWFNNIASAYQWQNEKRIVFLLRSLDRNSSRLGCDGVYKLPDGAKSYEEVVFQNMVDAIDYCVNRERYLYLDVGNHLSYKTIEEILK